MTPIDQLTRQLQDLSTRLEALHAQGYRHTQQAQSLANQRRAVEDRLIDQRDDLLPPGSTIPGPWGPSGPDGLPF